MKYILLSLLSFALFACDSENEKFIGSTFSHDIEGCDNRGNFEINCTEFVEFSENHADVLIGGGDIITRFNYKIDDNNILLSADEGNLEDIKFSILNSDSLQRQSDQSIWIKD